MTFLLDNSILQRVSRSSEIAARLGLLTSRGHVLAICAPSLDEASYSATSQDDLVRIRTGLRRGFGYLSLHEDIDRLIQDMRESLFRAGEGRSAGVLDVQVAAIAVHHGATVLHYDADFEDIGGAYPNLQQRWIVPRGSVD